MIKTKEINYSRNYLAGQEKISGLNHLFIAINAATKMDQLFLQFKPNQTVNIKYIRYGLNKETELVFDENPAYDIAIMENATKKMITKRNNWLH
jgi:hypothetical protein